MGSGCGNHAGKTFIVGLRVPSSQQLGWEGLPHLRPSAYSPFLEVGLAWMAYLLVPKGEPGEGKGNRGWQDKPTGLQVRVSSTTHFRPSASAPGPDSRDVSDQRL